MEPSIDLPLEWRDALDLAATARRILVVGPTDVGKSSFIHALSALRPEIALLDLDPGQKMVGPPGTISLGGLAGEPRLERFIFLGSTAVAGFRQLLAGASCLASFAEDRPLVVNTSGYVAGPGASLQLLTFQVLRPDLVVAIGLSGPLCDALHRSAAASLVRLERSTAARRKSEGRRRASRQQAFDQSMAGASEWSIATNSLRFEPGKPIPLLTPDWPVCALSDEAQEDMEIAILCSWNAASVTLFSKRPPRPAHRLVLGKMWARPQSDGVVLLNWLTPAWQASD